MAKVLGIGGIFFKSPNPATLFHWYEKWLGIPADPDSGMAFLPLDLPKNGFTVWNAFPASTAYFNPSKKEFMFNLVVDDLEEALLQVKEGGAQIVGEVEEYSYGKFGWFIDPDGNKVELWEPNHD
jgi:predicted enzyme related to lactoylglutathione lyase